MKELLFLPPRDAETGFLSNFYHAEFMLDGAHWPTVEQYYQAQKFTDAAYIEHIRLAATPRAAKNLGQTRDLPVRADWDSHRMTAMLRALVAKFIQHESRQQKLLKTGDAILVEASTHDGFWGEGPNHRGENRLGQLLTTLHKHLIMTLSQADVIRTPPEKLAQQCFAAVWLLHPTWWCPGR